ncbi:hypothetical protein ACLOJK_041511 [Asimina triloba]
MATDGFCSRAAGSSMVHLLPSVATGSAGGRGQRDGKGGRIGELVEEGRGRLDLDVDDVMDDSD